MKVLSVTLITLVLVCPAVSWAADIQTAGKMFLLGVGARSEGLGGSGTLLGEAAGGLLNPAAQTLTGDLAGSLYSSPRPYFTRGYDFWSSPPLPERNSAASEPAICCATGSKGAIVLLRREAPC
jgi:hypothetical protein